MVSLAHLDHAIIEKDAVHLMTASIVLLVIPVAFAFGVECLHLEVQWASGLSVSRVVLDELHSGLLAD